MSVAVVCLSGGLDSCVTLAEAMGEFDELAALHLSYGQRTEERERQAFEAICDHYGIERRLRAAQPALVEVGASALTDPSIEVPTEELGAPLAEPGVSAEELGAPLAEPGVSAAEPRRAVPITYVPFRNGQILAVACAWAEALDAHAVFLGAVEEDSSGYPDCRESFFAAFERAVDEGTRPETRIKLRTPLLHLRKGEIVKRGLELEAPLHLSWSCYTGSDLACGRCESCRLRLRGFAEAGTVDPISYLQI